MQIMNQQNRESVRVHKLLTQYGHQGAQRAQTECRALQLMSEFQRRQVFSHQESRRCNDFKTRVGIKANGLQRYFREQVLYQGTKNEKKGERANYIDWNMMILLVCFLVHRRVVFLLASPPPSPSSSFLLLLLSSSFSGQT